MPLGTEVSLDPSDIVLDGIPVIPSPKGGFGPCLLWPNGCMNQDMILGMEVGLGPGHIV